MTKRKCSANPLKGFLWTTLLLILSANSVKAQVIPDQTLPSKSVISTQGDLITIQGGTANGANLFHSFEQFSVSSGRTVFFKNSLETQNIFSRVTGGVISNIDGLIKANGTANLFLLNPSGILEDV